MYQIGPANGGKKTRPPPPPPSSDPLSSTCDRQFPQYFPQSDTVTSVRQHMSPANDSGGQARPSYSALTSGNDTVGTEESFRLVNIYCYEASFLLITKLKGQEVLLGKLASLADPSLVLFQLTLFRISLSM